MTRDNNAATIPMSNEFRMAAVAVGLVFAEGGHLVFEAADFHPHHAKRLAYRQRAGEQALHLVGLVVGRGVALLGKQGVLSCGNEQLVDLCAGLGRDQRQLIKCVAVLDRQPAVDLLGLGGQRLEVRHHPLCLLVVG